MSLTPLLLKSNWIKMTFQSDWRKEGIFIYAYSKTTVSDENSLRYNFVLPRTPLWAEQRVLKCSTAKMLIRMTNSWPTVFTAMAVNYFFSSTENCSSLFFKIWKYKLICWMTFPYILFSVVGEDVVMARTPPKKWTPKSNRNSNPL